MKKNLTLMVVLLAIYKLSTAQTTPAKPAVSSSYVSTAYTNVYPYQMGIKPKIDYSIHFKLNKGTKFTINDVKDSSGTILGYVITPWRYTEDTEKTTFYKTITDLGNQRLAAQKKLQDSILQQKAAVKAAKDKLHQDSLNVELSKKAVTKTAQAVSNTEQLFFTNLVLADLKKTAGTLPKANQTLKNKLNAFTTLRSKAQAQLSVGNDTDTVLKKQLISAAMALPVNKNSYIEQSGVDYQSKKALLNSAQQSLNNANGSLESIKAEYETEVAKFILLKLRGRSLQGQNSDNGPDPKAYRITKEQINDKLDTSADMTNQAAIYSDLAYLDSWANGWLFFISAKDFSDNSVSIFPHSNKFTWGFLTLPVKMRFDNNKGGRFDFEQNLNFGLTFGDKHQLVSTSDISLNYLLGLSVVNVPLDNATPATATTPATSATSTAAVSTSGGFMFQYDKFQIGAFLGWDFAGAHANEFKYQGKPWIGFAIGISLFGEGKTTPAAQTQ
ncbi:hypothetical protein [Mucilaginibacter sp. SP1R1]|uniref:hypothetical protein n=1 Tax=Mucilaginibacter sp. SP1R1 TaxID=2723091 RepID=UPI001609FCA0|nr:hypothetical protein [Mucilaginibacter sp. SP1R1]MBB6150332.1 hypothetical protein [Mucilaginibacter sp. SP1R1]